jgi:arylsulfatase A-like enzyme
VRQNGEQLDASKRILAQELQGHGYATAAFLTNMINAPNRGFDQKQGFRDGGDAAATTAAIAWLREHAGERFFVWLHLLGPHDPYVPSAEYRERFPSGYHGRLDGSRKKLERIWKRKRDLTEAELAHVVSLYDGDVAETDDQVDRALRALSELGLDGSTLVVLTSDHGEELYEHNHYFFHSYSIYESVLHVPLMLRLPGALPAGLVVDRPVESVDIAPTILEVLGLPVPDAYEGESLLPRIGAADQGGASSNEAAAFSELGPEIFSIQTARWHYIYNPRGHTSPNPEHLGRRDIRPYFNIEREELYDVVADPGETVNLAASRSDVAKALRERLVRWIEESDSDYRPGALLPEVEDELRALGYLD